MFYSSIPQLSITQESTVSLITVNLQGHLPVFAKTNIIVLMQRDILEAWRTFLETKLETDWLFHLEWLSHLTGNHGEEEGGVFFFFFLPASLPKPRVSWLDRSGDWKNPENPNNCACVFQSGPTQSGGLSSWGVPPSWNHQIRLLLP